MTWIRFWGRLTEVRWAHSGWTDHRVNVSLSLEAYLEAGLTRIMAGAEVLGAAKGQSAVQAFLDLVDADGLPLN